MLVGVVGGGVATLGRDLRLEVKAGVSLGCEGRSQKKVPLSSLIQSRVMNGTCHPPTAPTRSSALPFCSDTVVKCNLGDRG